MMQLLRCWEWTSDGKINEDTLQLASKFVSWTILLHSLITKWVPQAVVEFVGSSNNPSPRKALMAVKSLEANDSAQIYTATRLREAIQMLAELRFLCVSYKKSTRPASDRVLIAKAMRVATIFPEYLEAYTGREIREIRSCMKRRLAGAKRRVLRRELALEAYQKAEVELRRRSRKKIKDSDIRKRAIATLRLQNIDVDERTLRNALKEESGDDDSRKTAEFVIQRLISLEKA